MLSPVENIRELYYIESHEIQINFDCFIYLSVYLNVR